MIILPKNKLWALPSTAEGLAAAESCSYSYAEPDHILVISPEAPEGAKEITDDLLPLLGRQDWIWLSMASEMIRAEQEEQFREEIQKQQDEILGRFETALKKLREEEEANGRSEDN